MKRSTKKCHWGNMCTYIQLHVWFWKLSSLAIKIESVRLSIVNFIVVNLSWRFRILPPPSGNTKLFQLFLIPWFIMLMAHITYSEMSTCTACFDWMRYERFLKFALFSTSSTSIFKKFSFTLLFITFFALSFSLWKILFWHF